MDEKAMEIETGTNPVGSIIWLHGLGADGHDFEPIVPELRLSQELPLRFVFPHAPVQPVTVNGGMAMRAWFDIKSFDREGQPDIEGIDASIARLEELVEAETARGVPRSRIVLAGFSQGGVIAMHAALKASQQIGGLIALSSYLPLTDRLEGYAINTALPVFMGHGLVDPVLTIEMGLASRDAIKKSGIKPEWHEYPMAHGVCPQEIDDISRWLSKLYASITA